MDDAASVQAVAEECMLDLTVRYKAETVKKSYGLVNGLRPMGCSALGCTREVDGYA
jgi:hypothetical protein